MSQGGTMNDFVGKLNALSEEKQITQILDRAKENGWEVYEEDKRNFHLNIGKIQVKRTEYNNSIGRKVLQWYIWTGEKKIIGDYGTNVLFLISFLEGETVRIK
jgi:hypothetical protein